MILLQPVTWVAHAIDCVDTGPASGERLQATGLTGRPAALHTLTFRTGIASGETSSSPGAHAAGTPTATIREGEGEGRPEDPLCLGTPVWGPEGLRGVPGPAAPQCHLSETGTGRFSPNPEPGAPHRPATRLQETGRSPAGCRGPRLPGAAPVGPPGLLRNTRNILAPGRPGPVNIPERTTGRALGQPSVEGPRRPQLRGTLLPADDRVLPGTVDRLRASSHTHPRSSL